MRSIVAILTLFAQVSARAESARSACSDFSFTGIIDLCLDVTAKNKDVDAGVIRECQGYDLYGSQGTCLNTVRANPRVNLNAFRACHSFEASDVVQSCLEVAAGPNTQPNFYALGACADYSTVGTIKTCLATIKYAPGISAEDIKGCEEFTTVGAIEKCLIGLCPNHGLFGGCTAPAKKAEPAATKPAPAATGEDVSR